MMYHTFRDLIDAWPSIDDFAADIGVTRNTARQQRKRASVHAQYWEPLIAGAKRRAIPGISWPVLSRLQQMTRATRRTRSVETAVVLAG